MSEPSANPRESISALKIIRALEKHVLSGADMKPTQVTAALTLLKLALTGTDADGGPALPLDAVLGQLE